MTREEIVNSMSLQDAIQVFKDTNCYGTMDIAKSVILKALEQEPKIKMLNRDEVISKLGAVDIYRASAWATFFKDLDYLGMKIFEVEE